MNKLGFLLLVAVASTDALASEVGAQFPQLANSTAVLAAAIAETGVSASVATAPNDKANSAMQHPIDAYTQAALEQLSTELRMRIMGDLNDRTANDLAMR
jgi:hypothetical protein